MKVKVCIYSEKTLGAPLSVLMDPIYKDIDKFDEIGSMVYSALNAVSAYLPDQEVITMVESMGINRWMDIVNLQVYLRANNLVLLVTEVSTDQVSLGTDGVIVEVVSPKIDSLPVSTSYYSQDNQYDMVSIIEEQVNKFMIGDSNIIPESSIKMLLSAINDMKSKGMQIFPMYVDQLEYEFSTYGFQMFYIYLR